jgi:hypothetical protein
LLISIGYKLIGDYMTAPTPATPGTTRVEPPHEFQLNKTENTATKKVTVDDGGLVKLIL